MYRYINKKEENNNNSNKNANRYTHKTIVDNRPESKKISQLKKDINNSTAPIQRVMYIGTSDYDDIYIVKHKISKSIGDNVPEEVDNYIAYAINNGISFISIEILSATLIIKYLRDTIKKTIPSIHDSTISYIMDIIKKKNKLPHTFRSIEDIVLDNENLFGENFNNILFNNSVQTEMSLNKFLIECTNSDDKKIYNEISQKRENKSRLYISDDDIKELKDLILKIKPGIKLISQKTCEKVNKEEPVRDSLPNENKQKYINYLLKLCYDYYHVIKSEDDKVKARITLNINPDYYKAEYINKIIDICNKCNYVQSFKFATPKQGSIKIDNFIIYLKSTLDETKDINTLIDSLNNLNRDLKNKNSPNKLLTCDLPYTMKIIGAVGYGEEPHDKLSYGAKRSVIAKLALEQANTFDDYLTNAYLISEMAGIDITKPHKDSGIKSESLLDKLLTLNNSLRTIKSREIPKVNADKKSYFY